MSASRGEFSSRLGFIMAAAGSAIGLGNIWGFPGQTASNGGAAFVLVYLILAFLVAYPALMVEYVIGRNSKSNIVGAFGKISGGKHFKFVGYAGLLCATLILGFYSVIAGQMLAYGVSSVLNLIGLNAAANWAISGTTLPSMIFMVIFSLMTIAIVTGGVKNGIEKWSSRLMPTLLIFIVALIAFVFTQDGAMQGLKVYLVPDFSKVFEPSLIVSALGQAFFSLSLGVGTMLVYGSYMRKQDNLVTTAALVTLADVGIAFLAGLLIIPSMFVAEANGVVIYDQAGNLISNDNIVTQVLPVLFEKFGTFGGILSFLFFSLLIIASVTSSISMLELPVAHAVDDLNVDRKKASWVSGLAIMIISSALIFFKEELFGLVITIATQYLEPLVGLLLCIFVGWVMNRNTIIAELKQGNEGVEHSFFFMIWPLFVRFVVPVIILTIFALSFT